MLVGSCRWEVGWRWEVGGKSVGGWWGRSVGGRWMLVSGRWAVGGRSVGGQWAVGGRSVDVGEQSVGSQWAVGRISTDRRARQKHVGPNVCTDAPTDPHRRRGSGSVCTTPILVHNKLKKN